MMVGELVRRGLATGDEPVDTLIQILSTTFIRNPHELRQIHEPHRSEMFEVATVIDPIYTPSAKL